MKPTSSSLPIPRPARPRRWLPAAVCLLAGLLAAAPAHSQGPAVVDDLGNTVALSAPARRVVPLYGAFVDILAGMGLTDRVVARTEADPAPAGEPELPVIGTHMRPNIERVLAVRPDLVLQMDGRGEARESAARLAGLGIPTAVFAVSDFPTLFSAIDRIGVLCGDETGARNLREALAGRLLAVKRPAGPPPKVFFEVRSGSLLAAGNTSMASAVIAAAGGNNAVTTKDKIVRLSDEELLRLAPDVCLTQRGPMNPEARSMAERPEYATLPCVQNGRAFVVDEATFSRPGPGSVTAVEELAALLSGRPS
ncbi:ABC transporter substrate-binding protein [Solidesulfovibrio carbinolicus]|uniref:ABC transporter substrate-binding protein n=1 Tax=Solidesulfovibrio carbinolicus TaxID=296842 RepID=UPI001F3C2778|nr:ABC transporter substrate-binding protein [Solidesulfovibrio carbinolicus]